MLSELEFETQFSDDNVVSLICHFIVVRFQGISWAVPRVAKVAYKRQLDLRLELARILAALFVCRRSSTAYLATSHPRVSSEEN